MVWTGWISTGIGALALWCGLLLQLSTDRFTADDARILMGAGLGAMLAGLGFVVTIELAYPAPGKPVSGVQIAEANLTAPIAVTPQQPLGAVPPATTAVAVQSH